jgi:hypothetical protein
MSKFITFFSESIKTHTLSFVLFCLFLICLVFIWLLLKRRKKYLPVTGGEGENLDSIPLFSLEDPTVLDEQAMSVVEEYRKKIWYKTSSTPVMKSDDLLHLVENLASDIALVYHPDISEPMYEASMVDILGLVGRVNSKIGSSSREFPLSLIAERKISDVIKMKDFYQTVKNHPALEFAMKNKAFFKVGKTVWSAFNASNPWYWGRKVAYHTSREAGLRYFYALIVSQVGEEAVRVYSGRSVRRVESKDDLVIATEMVNMALVGGEVTSKEYETVLGFILGSKKLVAKDKIDLIRALTNKKRLKSLDVGILDNEKARDRLIRKVEALTLLDERFAEEKEKQIEELEKKLDYRKDTDREAT